MAIFHNIPKGGKGIKYSGKKLPKTRATKYKTISIALFMFIIIENLYIYKIDIINLTEGIKKIILEFKW